MTASAETRRHLRLLLVEDDENDADLVRFELERGGFDLDCERVDNEPSLSRALEHEWDVIISDFAMPGFSGLRAFDLYRARGSQTPFIFVSGALGEDRAVEAMRAGAFHYVTKPFHNEEILIQVKRALEQKRLEQELQRLRTEVRAHNRFQNIIGQSATMQKILETVAQVSDLPANILIEGESGTGKELIARAIHSNSSRASGPFIAVNCAAIPETLLESELFGYVRGAFTDARKDRSGLFREANGGMLFLDEISELPITLQSKLLRVLEDKEIRPLGANQGEKVDTRVLSASNRNLEELVRSDKFRQDLYYRLNVIRIELPPLRHRGDDVPLLVRHFVEKFAAGAKHQVDGIDAEALAALKNYDWPGNIRELEHMIERAVLLGKGSRIGLQDLPANVVGDGESSVVLAQALTRQLTLRDLEREYVAKVLDATNGNKTEAAKILGVDRTTLYRKLEEYKLKDDQ